MADGCHFENRYIAISQWKIIRFWWNFVHSSIFWTGWTSRDQKWKSCIGQTPSSTERISCFIASRRNPATTIYLAYIGNTKTRTTYPQNIIQLFLLQLVLKMILFIFLHHWVWCQLIWLWSCQPTQLLPELFQRLPYAARIDRPLPNEFGSGVCN